jgi:uncharacterized membrane protein YfcA
VSIVDILIIFVSIVVTSFISGLLSLGGGTILMGVFVWIMPVALAMMLHGLTQFVSNGSRAVVYWKHIRWPLISGYVIGALAITGIFSLIAYVPDKAVVFLLCGTLPFANYVIPKGYALDVTKRGQSVTCGFVNTGVMLTSGVSGPVLDVFFNKTDLTRFQIMGTKGLIQSLAHCLKVIYFGGIILVTTGEFDMGILPWWVFVAAIFLSSGGNLLASKFVNKMSDQQFRKYAQYMTLAIGVTFFVRGVMLLIEG